MLATPVIVKTFEDELKSCWIGQEGNNNAGSRDLYRKA